MRKIHLLFCILYLCTQPAFAQTKQLKYVQHFWYNSFELDGKEIKKKEARAFLQDNCPEAVSMFKKHRNTDIWSSVTGLTGGFLVGWELDNMFQGQFKPAAWAGFGLVAVSGFLGHRSTKGYVQLTSFYNQKCADKSVSLQWGLTSSNHIGWQLNF